MIRMKQYALIVVCLLAVAAIAAAGQDWKGRGRIKGKVLDEEGKGVRGAIVMIRHAELMAGPNIKTNNRGEFEFRDLKAGEWMLRVQADTFVAHQISVTVPERGSPEDIEITLEKDHTAEQLAELQDVLAKGDELFKAGQFAEARAEYEKVLEARPEVIGLHRSIAYTYGREGNHAKALEHMDIALGDAPDNAELLQLAAASSIAVGDADRSIGYVAKIPDAAIPDADMLANVAIGLLNKQYNPQAITVLDRAVALFPKASMSYYLRGMARLRLNNNAGGKEDLEMFVSLAPPDSPQLAQAKELISKIK